MTSLLPALAADTALLAAVLVRPHAGAVVGVRLRRLAPAPGDRADVGVPGAAHRSAVPVALVMELVAAALEAGMAPVNAVEAAIRACGSQTLDQLDPVVRLWRLGAAAEQAWSAAPARWRPLARSFLLSERTGASAARVLRSAARDLRAARRRSARVAAHRLGVRLVVPLGLTTLPAFLLWAVAPVVLGLAGQVLSGG